MDKPGFVDDRHFTEYVETVKQLKRDGQYSRAEELLIRLVDATEAESLVDGLGVAPWYYEQLAIIYSKMNNSESELAILERYERQRKAPGASPPKLAQRLRKLRERKNDQSE